VLAVPGFFHDRDDWKPNFETPSMNPQTLAAINSIWPHETEAESLNIYAQEPRSSHGPFFDIEFERKILDGIPFKEGGFQLLDSPYFGSFQDGEKNGGSIRYGPPLIF
jgi:hypothetical protein